MKHARLSLVCSLVLPFVLFAAGTMRADLVSHWPFDDSLEDIGPANQDMESVRGSPRYTGGVLPTREDGALSLDGEDDAVQADGGVFGNRGYSIAFWVRADPQSNTTIYSELGIGPALQIRTVGDRLQVHIAPRLPGDRSYTHTGRATVLDGIWHLVVWTDDGRRGSFSIDGRRDLGSLSRSFVDNEPGTIVVGRSASRTGPCCYFDGAIDDLQIYDHVLTSAEVAAMAAEVCSPVPRMTSEPDSLPVGGGSIRLTADGSFDESHTFWIGSDRVLDVVHNPDGTVTVPVSPRPVGVYDVSVRCFTGSVLSTVFRGLTIFDPCAPGSAAIDRVEPPLVFSGIRPIEIHGSGFLPGHANVRVGSRALGQVQVESPERITGVVPELPPGVHDVAILCDTGVVVSRLTGALEVTGPLTVRSVSPQRISVDGGAELTVVGTGFHASTRVTLAGLPLEDAAIVPGGAFEIIQGIAPAGLAPDFVDVRVGDSRGEVVLENAVEYVLPEGLPAPFQIESSLAEGTVRMSWQSPMRYETIEVLDSAGRLVASLPGATNDVELVVGESNEVSLTIFGVTEKGERSLPEHIIVDRKDCGRPPPLSAIVQEIRGRFEGLVYEDAEFSIYGGHAEAETERCADPDPLRLAAFNPPPRAGAMEAGTGSRRSRLGSRSSEATTGFVLEEPASRIEIALHYRKLQPADGLELRCRIAKVGPELGFVDEFTFPATVSSDSSDWHVMTYFRADSDVGRDLVDENDPGPRPCTGEAECVGKPLPAGEYTLTFYAVGASPAVAYYSISTDPSPEELLIPQTPCPPYPLVRVRDTSNEDVLPFVSEVVATPFPSGPTSFGCSIGEHRRRVSAVGYALDECNNPVPLSPNDTRFEYRFTIHDGNVPFVSGWSHRNSIERCFDCGCYRVDVEVRVTGCPTTSLFRREFTILPNSVECRSSDRFTFLYPQPDPGGIVGVVGLNDEGAPLGFKVRADKRPLEFSVLVSGNCDCPDADECPPQKGQLEFDLGVFDLEADGLRYLPLGADFDVEDLCSEVDEGPKYFRVSLDDVGRIPAHERLDDHDPTAVALIGRAVGSGDPWRRIGGWMRLHNPPSVLSSSSWRANFSEPNCYFFSVQSSVNPEHDFDLGASSDLNIVLPPLEGGEFEPIDVAGHEENNMCTGFSSRFSLDNGVWSDEEGIGGMRGSMMGNDISGAPLEVTGSAIPGDGDGSGAGGGDLPEWEWCSGGNIFNYQFQEDIYKGVIFSGAIWVIPVTVWATIGFGFFFNVDYQLTFQLHPFSIANGFEADCPENSSPGDGVGSLADAYMYLLASSGISLPASVRADIFFGVVSIALTLEPQASLTFTPWLETHANARVTGSPPSVDFDPTFDVHMYLDARFKLFAKVKTCIFWELECIEVPENPRPIINQPIFACDRELFDCVCPGCLESCDGETPPMPPDCSGARDGQGAGVNFFNVHAAITIPQTAFSPNGRRTLDVWMSADAAASGVLNIREHLRDGDTNDYVFTLRDANPYFLDPAVAYLDSDVAFIAFTETDGAQIEAVPPLDGTNTQEHLDVANRNAARANIRVHAITDEIRQLGSTATATLELIDRGVAISEGSADPGDWRVDGSASMVASRATDSVWVAWVRYEDDFLEYRGETEAHVPCPDCPPDQPYTVETVPDIQPQIDSAGIYVRQLGYDEVEGVVPVDGSAPTRISTDGINIEPELAAVANGTVVACVWVNDSLHDNLVDDNRGRNLHFSHWESATGSWSAPVSVFPDDVLEEYPGILEPRLALRQRDGEVDGLIAFTAIPPGADPNDTGLGGLRFLYLTRFHRQDSGVYQFEDPVRLRGACDAVVYAWDYVVTMPVDEIIVDPAEEIARYTPDGLIIFNRRGVSGTGPGSGEAMMSALGRNQNEWTAPVRLTDGTRVISNLSAAVSPQGEVRTTFLDGGARSVAQGFGAGALPRGVKVLETTLRPDLALASCRLSQQFPGAGARVRATVRVENRGQTSSAMDSRTGESFAAVQLVYHRADGRVDVVASEPLSLLEPGESEVLEFTIEMPHDPVQLEARIVANPDDSHPENDSSRCDFGAPKPVSVTCRLEQTARECEDQLRVVVEWENPVAYDELLVYCDGLLLARLPGSFERFVDRRPGLGLRRYDVRGCVDNSDSMRAGCGVLVECRPAGPGFRRGDVNGDADTDIGDVAALLAWLFSGGAAPSCQDAADTNDSGDTNVSDAVFVLVWLFLGGEPPAEPGPDVCGEDPTDDDFPECVDLDCL